MIEVKLRFWTNDISPEKGKIIPKHAWAAGVVRMEGNKSHGMAPSNLDAGESKQRGVRYVVQFSPYPRLAIGMAKCQRGPVPKNACPFLAFVNLSLPVTTSRESSICSFAFRNSLAVQSSRGDL